MGAFVLFGIFFLSVFAIPVVVALQNVSTLASVGDADFHIHHVSEDALFTTTGTGINPAVAAELLRIVNATRDDNGVRTARHFSEFVRENESGAIFVRLFESDPDIDMTLCSVCNYGCEGSCYCYYVAGITSMFTNNVRNKFICCCETESYQEYGFHRIDHGARWWQLVYAEDNVLTLWMVNPYIQAWMQIYAAEANFGGLINEHFAGVMERFPAARSYILPRNADDYVWNPSINEVWRTDTEQSIVDSRGMRTGLWEMNGLNREPYEYESGAWIESARLNRCGYGIWVPVPHAMVQWGLRPAISINLDDLKQPLRVNAGFDTGAAAGASVNVNDVTSLEVFAETTDTTTLTFTAEQPTHQILHVTINGQGIPITRYGHGNNVCSIDGVTHFRARFSDPQNRTVVLELWDKMQNLNIIAHVGMQGTEVVQPPCCNDGECSSTEYPPNEIEHSRAFNIWLVVLILAAALALTNGIWLFVWARSADKKPMKSVD